MTIWGDLRPMLALSFARAAREFFCGMSQCWRIFWVTVHSQLTDETGETVYVLLRPRRADFRTGWAAAWARPLCTGSGRWRRRSGTRGVSRHWLRRRASGSHRRAASLPAAAAPRSWEQGTRSSRAANAPARAPLTPHTTSKAHTRTHGRTGASTQCCASARGPSTCAGP